MESLSRAATATGSTVSSLRYHQVSGRAGGRAGERAVGWANYPAYAYLPTMANNVSVHVTSTQ